MKMYSLNRKHAKILDKYVKFIQGIIYEATEDCEAQKFEDFNEILINIVNYVNAFKTVVKNSSRVNEWAYMTPNLMLYACMGFLSGIRNKKNKKGIDELSEVLFERTVDFVGETSDILYEMEEKSEIKRRIKQIKKERNEHNS